MTEAVYGGGGDVQGRLWEMAAERVRENGFVFAPDGEGSFRNEAAAAAGRMFLRSRDGDADVEGGSADWDRATTNTMRLVDEMMVVARETGLARLHQSTMGEALARLCPLWPFC